MSLPVGLAIAPSAELSQAAVARKWVDICPVHLSVVTSGEEGEMGEQKRKCPGNKNIKSKYTMLVHGSCNPKVQA